MGYDKTVRDKAIGDRGLFERAAMYVPGYRGYRDRNMRREVDRQVRTETSRMIDTAAKGLSGRHREAVEAEDMEAAKAIERVRTKADTLSKKILSTESGYSGFWEHIKTEESEIDAISEWDAKLLESADAFGEAVEAANSPEGVAALEEFIDDVSAKFDGRRRMIKGLGGE